MKIEWKKAQLDEMAAIVDGCSSIKDALEHLQMTASNLNMWVYRFPDSNFARSVRALRERVKSNKALSGNSYLHMRVTPTLRQAIMDEAERTNSNISEVIRASLEAYLLESQE